MRPTSNLSAKGIFNLSATIYYSNEQLMKDCCLIPYLFHKYFGYRAVIVTARQEEYTYLDLLPGLEMDILQTPKDRTEWVEMCCQYISNRSGEIDILFCFGLYPEYFRMAKQYKTLRPDGKIVLKLDANINWVELLPFRDAEYAAFLKECDIITVESKKLQKYLSRKWPYKIDYVPNGSVDFASRERTEYSDKENTILTVGRIGTSQKANEILMEAFRLVADSLPQWKVKLIGGMEESFKPYVESFFHQYPHLKDRMIFTGKIVDKDILESEYKKAKIFALTSRVEGAPNVFVEAARNGCYIVCSEIDSADEATNGGQCGRSFEINNIEQLSQILIEACNDEGLLSKSCYDIQEYHDKQYSYERIVHKLHHLVNLPTGAV